MATSNTRMTSPLLSIPRLRMYAAPALYASSIAAPRPTCSAAPHTTSATKHAPGSNVPREWAERMPAYGGGRGETPGGGGRGACCRFTIAEN